MRENIELKNEGRKAWVSPELVVLSAGSAESGGSQNIPDGGPTSSPRS